MLEVEAGGGGPAESEVAVDDGAGGFAGDAAASAPASCVDVVLPGEGGGVARSDAALASPVVGVVRGGSVGTGDAVATESAAQPVRAERASAASHSRTGEVRALTQIKSTED